jgi:hypothetical protein
MANPTYKQILYIDSYASLPAGVDSGQLAMDMTTFSTYLFNGNAWTPLGRVIIKKDATPVNGKTTGTTLLYTLEASSLNFYPFAVIPRSSSPGVSGVTTGPTVSIGSNATSYNNIAAASLLSNALTTLTGGNSLSAAVQSPALAGGTQIYANVTIGAIATNYTLKYDILGYYDA